MDNLLLAVRSGNPALFILVLILALIVGGVSYYFSKGARIKRAIARIPKKNIRDVTNGDYVRLTGRISAIGEIIQAPLSGRECVYYSVIVEEKYGRQRWRKIAEEEVMADVILQDGDHYAVVISDHPKAYLIADQEYTSGFLDEPDDIQKAFLEEHGIDLKTILGFNRNLRYQEGILEPGEQVIVTGVCNWKPTSFQELKIPAEDILIVKTRKEQEVYITDDPQAISKR